MELFIQMEIPDHRRFRGTSPLYLDCLVYKRRTENLGGRYEGLRPADIAAAFSWCFGRRVSVRPAGAYGAYPGAMDSRACGKQFDIIKSDRQRCRCIHVFRYIDRSADYAGAFGCRDGTGSGAGAPSSGAIHVAALPPGNRG